MANSRMTFCKVCWLQRMPPHIQTVLSASSEPLDKLAIIADKVSEVVGASSTICAAKTVPPPSQSSSCNAQPTMDSLATNDISSDRRRSLSRFTWTKNCRQYAERNPLCSLHGDSGKLPARNAGLFFVPSFDENWGKKGGVFSDSPMMHCARDSFIQDGCSPGLLALDNRINNNPHKHLGDQNELDTTVRDSEVYQVPIFNKNYIPFSGISSDDTKHSALVANLDAETLSYVSDIVLSPRTVTNITLSRSGSSPNLATRRLKIKKLLTDLQLGEESPATCCEK
ncbi:hypothetical protein TNCV_862311 [Trichonephila clavipes]|nr:hypothetical protein TNCV_862311 [Trichonephila clavipes]